MRCLFYFGLLCSTIQTGRRVKSDFSLTRTCCAPRGDDGKNQFASLNNFVILNNNVAVASAYSPQECACRWHAHCVSNLEKSTQGVTTLCYKKWIALARLKPQSEPRNDKFFYFKLLTKNLNNVIILPL